MKYQMHLLNVTDLISLSKTELIKIQSFWFFKVGKCPERNKILRQIEKQLTIIDSK